MGTIQCGFWRIRFWVTPEEFEAFLSGFEQQGFSLYDCTAANNKLTAAEFTRQYRILYTRVTNPLEYSRFARNEFCVCTAHSLDFHGGFHLVRDVYDKRSRWPNFLQLASPKGYSVNDEDGYFHYEDILQIEPRAKEMFDLVTAGLKKTTKPLYCGGNPVYSIRISSQAWLDLQGSRAFQELGAGYSTKWKNKTDES